MNDSLDRLWICKRKGNAKIYTHPQVIDGRAVVENHLGVSFNGRVFPTLVAAKQAALLNMEQLNNV